MVFWAVAVVLLGIVLKAIAAEPGSMILLPLAAIAGFYHVTVHREAARSANPPLGLAAISDIAMLGALNERSLRDVGNDLCQGPGQHLALALLRFGALAEMIDETNAAMPLRSGAQFRPVRRTRKN